MRKVRGILPAAGLAISVLILPEVATADEFFDCVMDPSTIVNLASPVGGIVEAVVIDRGARVRVGDEIARLDSRVESANLKVLEMRASNSASVDAQAARLKFLEAKLERSRGLAASGVVTRSAIEEMEADVETARNFLVEAITAREIARQELERARVASDLLHLRSPVEGLVTKRSRSAGEFLHPEASIATIVAIDPLFVETFLPVEMFGQVKVGDRVIVEPAAPLTGEYEATVDVIDQVFDASSGTFGVRSILRNPDSRLPGGHRCRLRTGRQGSG